MNGKIPFIAAGVIASVAAVVFIFLIGSSFNRLFISESTKPNAEGTATPTVELNLDKVSVNKTSNNTAAMQVSFAVRNSGRSTAMLQTVQYSVLVNGIKIVSGAVGKQSEDVLSGQGDIYPILANDTVYLKDTQSFAESNVGSTIWDEIAAKKANYIVKGIYLFRDNTRLQAAGVEKNFELAFPPTTASVIANPNNQNNSSIITTLPKLVQTISLPNVNGRIDHMSIDLQGKRLFIAELESNSIEVIDLKSGKRTGSISNGLNEPQGVMYIPETNRIAVANGGDGSVKFYDSRSSFSLVGDIKLTDDADNIRYDNTTRLLYLGHGEGAVAVVNATTDKIMGDIKLNGHPESFQLERSGTRIFINVPSDHSIEVADKQNLQQPASRWSTDATGASENFPMALDEANHRLFVGFRDPPKVIVYDTQTGKEVTSMDTTKDADDIFYNLANRQIYVSGGEGSINVYKQINPDNYEFVSKIATSPGARTSLFVPELNSLYLAVPASTDQQDAQLRIYEVQ